MFLIAERKAFSSLKRYPNLLDTGSPEFYWKAGNNFSTFGTTFESAPIKHVPGNKQNNMHNVYVHLYIKGV